MDENLVEKNNINVEEVQYEIALPTNEEFIQEFEQELETMVFGLSTPINKSKDTLPSQQLDLESAFNDLYSSNDVIVPPYNPILWSSLMEKNTRLGKLIRTAARNTVGRGFNIIPINPITRKTTKKQKELIESQTQKLKKIFAKPSTDFTPFPEIMYRVKVDEESAGNGYIEVVRDIKNEIGGIYHVPGHTVRIRKGGKGYVQIWDGEKRFFKPFGAKFEVDKDTGEVFTNKKRIAFKRRASELIHFKVYSPTSAFYGAPRYVGAATAIAGNQLSARRNISFFKNDATPRIIITVSNGQLSQESVSLIKDFVQNIGKGADNSHRALVIQAKAKQIGPEQQANTRINVTPLTVGVTEDGSFLAYRNANDEELRESFGQAKVFLGAGDLNRATSYIARNITNEQEFLPDIEIKESIINSTIVNDILKNEPEILVKLEFIRPKSTDELQDAEIFVRYLQGGGITPNDIRHKLNKPEFKEKWGDIPIQIALIMFQMGFFGGKDNTEEGGEDPQNQARNEDTSEDGIKTPSASLKNGLLKINNILEETLKNINNYSKITFSEDQTNNNDL